MTDTIEVNLKENSYPIVIGQDLLSRAGSLLRKADIGRDAVIITNRFIRRLHGNVLAGNLQRHGFSGFVLDFDSEQGGIQGKAGNIEGITFNDFMDIDFVQSG